jgi:uncharacterized protein (DUF952 family)
MAETIVHIATAADWQRAREAGVYTPASLQTEGFVHCSTEEQLASTLARHFRGRRDLVLLTIDTAAIADSLRWEKPKPNGGSYDPDERFPHVYGAIPLDAVHSAEAIEAP